MSIAKQIILDELREQSQVEPVEDIIFWALEHYANSKYKSTTGAVGAYCIKQRILEAEKKESENK